MQFLLACLPYLFRMVSLFLAESHRKLPAYQSKEIADGSLTTATALEREKKKEKGQSANCRHLVLHPLGRSFPVPASPTVSHTMTDFPFSGHQYLLLLFQPWIGEKSVELLNHSAVHCRKNRDVHRFLSYPSPMTSENGRGLFEGCCLFTKALMIT